MHLCTPIPSEMLARDELNSDDMLEGLPPFLVRRTQRPWFPSADGTSDCVHRQWFLEVFLGPFSNVNDRIMPMSDAVSSEGPKTTGIQQRSSDSSLTHRDFSCFSESFDDVVHCRLWDLQNLCNLILRNVVFKRCYSTIFLHTLSQIGEHLHIFTSKRHPFYS